MQSAAPERALFVYPNVSRALFIIPLMLHGGYGEKFGHRSLYISLTRASLFFNERVLCVRLGVSGLVCAYLLWLQQQGRHSKPLKAPVCGKYRSAFQKGLRVEGRKSESAYAYNPLFSSRGKKCREPNSDQIQSAVGSRTNFSRDAAGDGRQPFRATSATFTFVRGVCSFASPPAHTRGCRTRE
jgi:hypothetical protein